MSNPCVGPLQESRYLFFLLSMCADEIISVPIIITFLPNPLPSDNKIPFPSNPIPYQKYLYLSESVFLVKLTAPNKESFSVKSELYLHSHKFISYNFHHIFMIKM